tara:strand:+ start:2782 stop:4491 length:1710 start_codon:yes stop_codon:yes gene_type:complete
MNIDALVESFYSKLDENEDLINEVMKFLLTEAPASTEPKSETFTFDLIPTIPVNELGWGAMVTPKGRKTPVPVDKGARVELSQYLQNIGKGKDLRGKIEELNRFFEGKSAPGPTGGPGNQLRKTISYLVFYKTLTQIITNFNASSAGFSFESFLAVLLDAKRGRQVPASGAETIADIIVYKEGRPISLKLYREGGLKVGGSYRQLIEDLTRPPYLMEYIVVTKDVEEGVEGISRLSFFAFNFTLNNVVEILPLGANNIPKMSIPGVFFDDGAIAELKAAGGFAEYLKLPKKGSVNVKPLLDYFIETATTEMQKNGIPDEMVASLEQSMAQYIDMETGELLDQKDAEKPRILFKSNKNGGPAGSVAGGGPAWKTLVRNIRKGLVGGAPAEAKAAQQLLGQAYLATTEKFKEAVGTGGSRETKFKELAFRSGEESIARLKELRKDPEIYKLALQNSVGVSRREDFDLTKGQLEAIGNANWEDDQKLYPYDEFDVGTIEIGVQKVQDMLDNSVNTFNSVIFQVFTDLKTLSVNLNGYVASGLNKPEMADTAKEAAEDIATGTGDIADEKDAG